MISTPGTRFSRAVRGASSAFACGVSLGHAFPAGVSYLTFQSAGTSFLRDIVGKLALLLQFVYSLAVQSIFRQKEFRIALTPNHNLKTRLFYPSCFFTVPLKGCKKFARLLPNNWLAETPQALVPRRLGRQSAERERISGINWNGFQKKKLQTLL
ncbi:hypothetical protein L8956_23230 [Peribacillus frigoritolerans]|uniref:hypothetical protein n=1 Tax=Peribacillus frigoritolerans TaxID=450367 RepID=UPI001EFDC71C|nr:hypothetical protein [Peribacillus frigoritolerans]ULM96668.1 hypothetical protein L8956_23230 [Peribacillus frigoritolerans]